MPGTEKKKAQDRERMQRNRAKQNELINDLIRVVEFYANPSVYEPHPHGPAFDRRDVSYVAISALRKHGHMQ